MPIPRPRPNEKREQFISRCMGDDVMVNEYSDPTQRNAICFGSWRKAKLERGETMLKDILSIGTWNNIKFTAKDLLNIAEAFKKLKDIHHVPLKLGHDDPEKYQKEQPAMGWVEDVFVDGGKLWAKIENIPDVLRTAFDKKLYRKVSVELDRGVEHQGDNFDWVLSGVAVLGTNIPAVNNLEDLGAYFALTGGERVSFAYETINNEDDIMPLEALTKKVEDLTNNFSTLQAQNDELAKGNQALKNENTDLKKQVEEFSKKETERVELEAKQKVTDAREKVTAFFNKLVDDKHVTPGERDTFMDILGVADDAKVVHIDLEKVKAMPGINGKIDFGRNTAHQGSGDQHRHTSDNGFQGQDLVDLANDYIDQNGGPEKVTFARAVEKVSKDNPDLAAAWKN